VFPFYFADDEEDNSGQVQGGEGQVGAGEEDAGVDPSAEVPVLARGRAVR
jgi:hypothetical protein